MGRFLRNCCLGEALRMEEASCIKRRTLAVCFLLLWGNTDENQLKEGKGYMAYMPQVCHWGKQRELPKQGRSLDAGTEADTVKERCLLPCSPQPTQFACFLQTWTGSREWQKWHQSVIKKMPPKTDLQNTWWRPLSQLRVSLSRFVNLTKRKKKKKEN